MPSRLSSLLVRDGLVGVKRMEHAFQRQVIYGGCLDTILLEMSLVPEERLLQYLALATGLPPATRAETNVFDSQALQICTADLARGYRVVPLCFEEGALRVLVHDPVDLSLLEELANEIDVPVQPLVVPEYRFHLVFARMFGGTPNARFSALAKRAEEQIPTLPVGKSRSVIIEEVGGRSQRQSTAPGLPPFEDIEDYQDEDESAAEETSMYERTARRRSVTREMASGALARRSEEISTEAHDPEAGFDNVPTLERDPASRPIPVPDPAFDSLPTMDHLPARDPELPDEVPLFAAVPTVEHTPVFDDLATEDEAEGSLPGLALAETAPIDHIAEPARPRARTARATVQGLGLPGVGTAGPITAPMGSRNSPAGRNQVVGDPRAGTAPPAPARPTAERPATARPATARPATARPATARPATDEELTSERPATARWTTDEELTSERPATARWTTDEELTSERPATARWTTDEELTSERPATARPITDEQPTTVHPALARTSRPATERPVITFPDQELVSTPISAADARQVLATADDRDIIFGVLLRAIRAKSWYAGLLTVQGAAAIGRVAIAGDDIDRDEIASVLIPLDDPSAFHNVVTSAAPHIGPIVTGDSEIDSMIRRMGGVIPRSALLLPVVLRNRVVALAIGHSREQPVDVTAVSELLPLASLAAEALSRLIVKAKATAKRDTRETPPQRPSTKPPAIARPATKRPAMLVDEDEEPSLDENHGTEPARAGDGDTADAGPVALSLEAEEPAAIEEVLDAVESDDDVVAEHAKAEALLRADEIIDEMIERFPGKLRFARYESGGHALPPSRHGNLLDLVVRLGAASGPILSQKLRDTRRDVRYYATLCAAELRPPDILPALVERLFDSDYGIRLVALDALRGYGPQDMESALVRARHALHSEDPKRVEAAASALASLADTRSIPDLMDALGRGDRVADHARRALVQLTAQDFGASARKWRAWWSKHKRESRIEWLLEGLASREESIRQKAAEELRTITGEDFDYHADGPKKEREQARQRWLDWWHEVGRTRFAKADENTRSTALLPSKS